MLDVNSIYGMPGDPINFDVDHINPEIDSQISSYRLEGHWEDGLDWLNISPSGQLYGEIPQGFEMGGANIVATHPFGRCVPVVQYLSAFYERNDGEEISVGDTWMNIGEGAATNGVFVNTTQSAIFHEGQYIYGANSITLADGKVYSISDYDVFREGKGIEVHTTQFDDYINLTGYTAADFYGTESNAPIDITTSVGNDVYIGPSFLNNYGNFVSVLDNQHYFNSQTNLV